MTILNRDQQRELAAYKTSLEPIAIAVQIDRLQQRLTCISASKTRQLERKAEAARAA